MRLGFPILMLGLAATMQPALAQDGGITVPKTVEAGSAFSIQSTGSGKATLYIVGLGQVLKRDVNLGETTSFPAESLSHAGHYLVVFAGANSTESGAFDVTPAGKPTELSFLAEPSRLPVGLRDGITGAAYVFDAYGNLIVTPSPVSFELSSSTGAVQKRTVTTRDGAAWIALDSTAQQGKDKFVAEVDGISATRVIGQVAGDPCGLNMSAKPSGNEIELETDPVRDCSGNAVPDGTIVTFTESYRDSQSTVDVPLKRGIAKVDMPAHDGATITVASGVVMGNQIRWEGR
ncbi:MAG: hypothetical protein WBE76_15350 [Terracidiphilus sp.]